MDMKKILQAFDGANDAAPIADATDMKKFLSIVVEGKDSGNRLTQAEQLAMQTYADPQKVIKPDTAKKGLFKEFYEKYEKALNEELEEQEEYTLADIAEMVRQGMSNEDIANELGFNLNEGKIKGADGKACWKGKRYGGTKNGKDICLPVKGNE
jgi:ATP/maltotriose-dependent transcriptional regulator MalT